MKTVKFVENTHFTYFSYLSQKGQLKNESENPKNISFVYCNESKQ